MLYNYHSSTGNYLFSEQKSIEFFLIKRKKFYSEILAYFNAFHATCFQEVDGKAHRIGPLGEEKSGRKRVKREAIVGPAVDKDVSHEAVGVKPATLVPKEIPMIKKKNSVLQVIILRAN